MGQPKDKQQDQNNIGSKTGLSGYTQTTQYELYDGLKSEQRLKLPESLDWLIPLGPLGGQVVCKQRLRATLDLAEWVNLIYVTEHSYGH